MNFQIREAHLSDYKYINALHAEMLGLHIRNRPDAFINRDVVLQEEEFNELLTSETAKIFVVKDMSNDEMAAYGLLKFMLTQDPHILIPTKYAQINEFCVAQNYKRKGLGKMLFQHIVEYVKAQDVASLQLNMWDFNNDARAFYEAMGMTTRQRRMELNLKPKQQR